MMKIRVTKPTGIPSTDPGFGKLSARSGDYFYGTDEMDMITKACAKNIGEPLDIQDAQDRYLGRFIMRPGRDMAEKLEPMPEVLVVVIKDSVVDEVIRCNADDCEERFLEKCREVFSNFGDYSSDDIDAILDNGYESGNGNSVCIHHL